jgi:hypothetical protein
MEAVGIGCFWFARFSADDADDDEDFTPTEHLNDIREALEGVDNVSNVEVIGEGNVYSSIAGLEDEEGGNFFPIYSNVTLCFDIFLPARHQQKYALGRTADDHEHFHVRSSTKA